MEESLLKSNFLGRDGFRWWIGQIPPVESQDAQMNKDGWGNRSKVRIVGYHPYSVEDLPDKELPWAQVLMSNSDGSGAANYGTNHKLRPGDIVFGFFLDGDNAQVPVIMGCFGRTDQVATSEYSSPFVPFTGYTERVKNDGSRVKVNEQNEQTTQAQKSPYHLPPQTANSANELSYFSGIGDTVLYGTTNPGSKMDKISTELENAVKFLQDIQSFPNLAQDWISDQKEKLCKEVTEKISAIAEEIISGIVNDTYEKMIPPLNEAAKLLYDDIYAKIFAATDSISEAHLGAAKAVGNTHEPVQKLQQLIPCLIEKVAGFLAGLIGDMVCALLDNIENFVSCVVDQFLSGMLNGIIGSILSGMAGVINLLSVLLAYVNFDLESTLKGSSEGLLGIPISLNCSEDLQTAANEVKKWEIGSGAVPPPSFNPSDILGLANTVKGVVEGSETPLSALESITGPLGFLSSDISTAKPSLGGVKECFAGKPTIIEPPKINIFGGGGSGASAVPIVVGGSVIGAIVTDGGSGYKYPPFISIKDNARQGYGAVAQSVVNDGRVTAIIINSSGDGYVVGNNPEFTIRSILIQSPGYNYKPEDTVTDNFGNQYVFNIVNGSFVKVAPINIKEITEQPILRIKSKTGSGAKLQPVLDFKRIGQVEVKQVIDCVT